MDHTDEEPRWLDETEMRAWTGLLDTFHLLQRDIDAQLRAEGGVTQVQYEILTRLAESPNGDLRMSDLADRLVASRSGLTYQVTQLVTAGLVRRLPDPGDDRAVLAAITDAGRDVLQRAAPGHVRVVRQGLLDALTARQVGQLADIMDRARAHLRG